MPFLTVALYKFVELPDHAALQAPLLAACLAHGIKGTLLLAPEGINGTIAGLPDDVHAVLRTRAAAVGLSLSGYLLREAERIAERPPLARRKQAKPPVSDAKGADR